MSKSPRLGTPPQGSHLFHSAHLRPATLDLALETAGPSRGRHLGAPRPADQLDSLAELRKLLEEVRDRYGAPPESVLNLAEYASIRLLADAVGLESIDRDAQTVVLKFRSDAKVDPTRLFRLVQDRGDLTLVPPATLKLSLAGPIQKPAPADPASGFRRDIGRGGSQAGRGGSRTAPARGKDPVASGSWWAARAQAGEVTGGFSKQEILKPAKDDPRGETGVFARVSSLLRDLGDRPRSG